MSPYSAVFEIGLGQGVVAGPNQLGDAAAQDGLLAEQVGLGLVLERGLDHPAAGAADALAVGEGERQRVAGGVLVDGDQARYPRAFEELPAHQMARPLRRHQRHVDVGRRHHLAVVD